MEVIVKWHERVFSLHNNTIKNTNFKSIDFMNWVCNNRIVYGGRYWDSICIIMLHSFKLVILCVQDVKLYSKYSSSSFALAIGKSYFNWLPDYIMAREEQVASNPLCSSKARFQTAFGLDQFIEFIALLLWFFMFLILM